MRDEEYVPRKLLDAALRALAEAQRQLYMERSTSDWLRGIVGGDGGDAGVGGAPALP